MKQAFANELAFHQNDLMANECERYGMTWGCDTDCPTLRHGECHLRDNENKELWEWLKEKQLNHNI